MTGWARRQSQQHLPCRDDTVASRESREEEDRWTVRESESWYFIKVIHLADFSLPSLDLFPFLHLSCPLILILMCLPSLYTCFPPLLLPSLCPSSIWSPLLYLMVSYITERLKWNCPYKKKSFIKMPKTNCFILTLTWERPLVAMWIITVIFNNQ